MGAAKQHTLTMSDDEGKFDIETTDSGAAAVASVEAGQIRAGGYIMIKGKPCKVKNVSVSKTGKHGHAKCKFAASDIFTGATCEELCPSTHNIDIPIVSKKDWQVTGVTDETYVLLMDDDGEMREDLQLPDVTFKTEDDNTASKLIQDYCAMVDDGSNIEIYCTMLAAVGLEKITDIRKKEA